LFSVRYRPISRVSLLFIVGEAMPLLFPSIDPYTPKAHRALREIV